MICIDIMLWYVLIFCYYVLLMFHNVDEAGCWALGAGHPTHRSRAGAAAGFRGTGRSAMVSGQGGLPMASRSDWQMGCAIKSLLWHDKQTCWMSEWTRMAPEYGLKFQVEDVEVGRSRCRAYLLGFCVTRCVAVSEWVCVCGARFLWCIPALARPLPPSAASFCREMGRKSNIQCTGQLTTEGGWAKRLQSILRASWVIFLQ